LDPESFDHFLFQLPSYKANTGNYHVAKEEHPDLHAWIAYLKREYKAFATAVEENECAFSHTSALTPEQMMKVLESLQVPLTLRGDEHWNRFYEMLVEYKDRHGHALVPQLCEVPGLGDWVHRPAASVQSCQQGESSQLSEQRKRKLADLGFIWQVRRRPEWDARYSELLEYKKKHGDCKVPQHYKANKALGKWVAKQSIFCVSGTPPTNEPSMECRFNRSEKA
jgi:hypothetical protein